MRSLVRYRSLVVVETWPMRQLGLRVILGGMTPHPRPPSTPQIWPVTKLHSGPASMTITRATSSALATRPSGWICSLMFREASFESRGAASGVSVSPGATALNRMPVRA